MTYYGTNATLGRFGKLSRSLKILQLQNSHMENLQASDLPPSEPPGEIMSFGMSPVNYSDSDSLNMGLNISILTLT